MDFGALLHYAKKNNDAATKEEVSLQTLSLKIIRNIKYG